jgi:hypothetical protein
LALQLPTNNNISEIAESQRAMEEKRDQQPVAKKRGTVAFGSETIILSRIHHINAESFHLRRRRHARGRVPSRCRLRMNPGRRSKEPCPVVPRRHGSQGVTELL